MAGSTQPVSEIQAKESGEGRQRDERCIEQNKTTGVLIVLFVGQFKLKSTGCSPVEEHLPSTNKSLGLNLRNSKHFNCSLIYRYEENTFSVLYIYQSV